MKKLTAALAFTALLGACATADITTPPLTVTPKDVRASIGIDVYGRARAAGNPVPRFRGQETVQVRTNGSRNGEGFGEITGSKCSLDSGLYTASFLTPANVIVPDYGPDSPALFIMCTAPDGRTKSVTVSAINMTSDSRNNSAAGTGLLGAIIIGAVNESRRNNETDDFGYYPITLAFPSK